MHVVFALAPLLATMSQSSSSSPSALIKDRAKEMNMRVGTPFIEDEIAAIQTSLQKLYPASYDLSSLPKVLREVAHISHKANWGVTRDNAHWLASSVLWPKHPEWEPAQHQLLHRVLRDGNWEGASKHRLRNKSKPWAVLVTVRLREHIDLVHCSLLLTPTLMSPFFSLRNTSQGVKYVPALATHTSL